ncbi:hypothetical protein BACCIP111895_00890 [Neobacillus rhizosphaerae]|uniref:Uncharacterized protein n=1 Tax=Neobacillus rhizosphaerae TaxID=2880965 RepID=A0ABM9EMF2_9BACI|nr:hypothetical protein BACCIP111895_00890 [Neobacillus rhizosphaerae]
MKMKRIGLKTQSFLAKIIFLFSRRVYKYERTFSINGRRYVKTETL